MEHMGPVATQYELPQVDPLSIMRFRLSYALSYTGRFSSRGNLAKSDQPTSEIHLGWLQPVNPGRSSDDLETFPAGPHNPVDVAPWRKLGSKPSKLLHDLRTEVVVVHHGVQEYRQLSEFGRCVHAPRRQYVAIGLDVVRHTQAVERACIRTVVELDAYDLQGH